MTSPETSSAQTQPDRGVARRVLSVLGAALIAVWASSCFLFVDETEVVIVERLGKIVSVFDRAEDRGLAVKLPWPIGTVRRFDRRVQLFDPAGREMFTRDKKNITVDAYLCWKIAEPTGDEAILDRPAVRFFRALGAIPIAQAQLETRVRSALATRIAQVELSDLMRVVDSESPPEAEPKMSLDSIAADLLRDVRQRSEDAVPVRELLGIDVVDVRIKRINFPLGNQQAVFDRMKSERQKIADRYRSAGLAENTVIRSHADRQYNEIMAKADAEAERIRGDAEAEALGILNQAHARDPEFYQALKTLDGYKKVLGEKTTLVLSASSGLLKLLVEGVPELKSAAPAPEAAPAEQPVAPAKTEGDAK